MKVGSCIECGELYEYINKDYQNDGFCCSSCKQLWERNNQIKR